MIWSKGVRGKCSPFEDCLPLGGALPCSIANKLLAFAFEVVADGAEVFGIGAGDGPPPMLNSFFNASSFPKVESSTTSRSGV